MASVSAMKRWMMSFLWVGFVNEEKKLPNPSGSVSVDNVRPYVFGYTVCSSAYGFQTYH